MLSGMLEHAGYGRTALPQTVHEELLDLMHALARLFFGWGCEAAAELVCEALLGCCCMCVACTSRLHAAVLLETRASSNLRAAKAAFTEDLSGARSNSLCSSGRDSCCSIGASTAATSGTGYAFPLAFLRRQSGLLASTSFLNPWRVNLSVESKNLKYRLLLSGLRRQPTDTKNRYMPEVVRVGTMFFW